MSIDNLNFLIDNNPIVPEGREDIFKQGIYFGLSDNLYVAMHILLPETENLIRNLVKLCGDTTTFLHTDGTEDTKLLSKLFGSQKLKGCYSEDIIFNLQSIMDNPLGENLRNLTAHGILSPEEGSSTKALSFLCLLIKLLSMYSRTECEMMACCARHFDLLRKPNSSVPYVRRRVRFACLGGSFDLSTGAIAPVFQFQIRMYLRKCRIML